MHAERSQRVSTLMFSSSILEMSSEFYRIEVTVRTFLKLIFFIFSTISAKENLFRCSANVLEEQEVLY